MADAPNTPTPVPPEPDFAAIGRYHFAKAALARTVEARLLATQGARELLAQCLSVPAATVDLVVFGQSLLDARAAIDQAIAADVAAVTAIDILRATAKSVDAAEPVTLTVRQAPPVPVRDLVLAAPAAVETVDAARDIEGGN